MTYEGHIENGAYPRDPTLSRKGRPLPLFQDLVLSSSLGMPSSGSHALRHRPTAERPASSPLYSTAPRRAAPQGVAGDNRGGRPTEGATRRRSLSDFAGWTADGPAWSYPVVHQGRLYLRHGDLLACYDLRPSPAAEGKPGRSA
jgi:hypothetical protein